MVLREIILKSKYDVDEQKVLDATELICGYVAVTTPARTPFKIAIFRILTRMKQN